MYPCLFGSLGIYFQIAYSIKIEINFQTYYQKQNKRNIKQADNKIENMQKVPHLHIFGSNDSDYWRKRSGEKFRTNIHDTWTSSSTSGEFLTPYKQRGYDSQLYYRSMRRSNSQKRLLSKPFANDYYANAIRICDDNRLKNIIGHDIEHLNSPYLVKGCRRRRKNECVECKQDELRKQNKVAMQNSNVRVQQVRHMQQPAQNTTYTIIHSPPQQQVVNRVATINAKPIVSFQYVGTNVGNEVRYPTFRVMDNNQERNHIHQQQVIIHPPAQQVRQLVVTENNNHNSNSSYVSNNTTVHNNSNTLTAQSKFITLGPTKRPHQLATMTTISRNQSHNFLPQISGLINQLSVTGQSGDSDKTKIMLDELEQAARKQLLVRQKCINKLDDLIAEYGKEVVEQRYEKQQTSVVRTRASFFC